MLNYFISFTANGGISFEAEDVDQVEFDALNYIRDTYPELSNIEITEVKVI